tara:strand:- start:54328 stop:54675 length:348 start_codon:yes stop_codon:yes gene_type:complete
MLQRIKRKIFGIREMPTVTSRQQESGYVTARANDPRVTSGELVPWRQDHDGTQWYRAAGQTSRPSIHAIEPDFGKWDDDDIDAIETQMEQDNQLWRREIELKKIAAQEPTDDDDR